MKNIIIVILLTSNSILYCQEKSITNNIWISCGAGLYQQENFVGGSLNSSVNCTRVKHFDTIKGTHNKSFNVEFRLNKYISSLDEDNYENFTEVGLLYGKTFGKYLQLKIASGLGFLNGVKTVGYWGTRQYSKKISTCGIPLVFGINLAPGKHFGIGVDSSINLYPNNTIYGVNFRLLFGNIW